MLLLYEDSGNIEPKDIHQENHVSWRKTVYQSL